MPEAPQKRGSRISLTSILIAVGTIAVVAAIILPPYLRSVFAERRKAEFEAHAQPVLDRLIEAERPYKEQHGKFWRGEHEVLADAETKQALGVDLSSAPQANFSIYPPDLEADPTLRVAAKGKGDKAGLTIECVYDSIAHTKTCKSV
jgi:hypothetical protein